MAGMNHTDRERAEAAVRHLCLGLQVVGVRWYGALILAIEPVHGHSPDRRLTVESRIGFFPHRPDGFPDNADELPDLPLAEQVAGLARLAGQDIVGAELGDSYSHLILTFVRECCVRERVSPVVRELDPERRRVGSCVSHGRRRGVVGAEQTQSTVITQAR
jgi:hypothetical protein